MSNHVHLVISTKSNNTSDVLGDFKKFTAKKIIQCIQESNNESRKDWMLDIFKRVGVANSRNEKYQFWRQENQPKELFSEKFTNQKLSNTFIIIQSKLAL